MKFYEALRLCIEGERKIKMSNWPNEFYIEYKLSSLNDGSFVLLMVTPSTIRPWIPEAYHLLSDQWEIYNEIL